MNGSFAAGTSPTQPHPAPRMPVAEPRSPSHAGQRQPGTEHAGRATRKRADRLPTTLLSYARAFDTLQLTGRLQSRVPGCPSVPSKNRSSTACGHTRFPWYPIMGAKTLNPPILLCSSSCRETNLAKSEILANSVVSQDICALMQKLVFAIE